MQHSDDPRLLRGLVSHRVLVLSNTLALAAARYYPRRFGIRLAEWRVIDALHAGRGITAIRISQCFFVVHRTEWIRNPCRH